MKNIFCENYSTVKECENKHFSMKIIRICFFFNVILLQFFLFNAICFKM